MFEFTPIEKCKKQYHRLLKQKNRLMLTEETEASHQEELSELRNRIMEFIEGEYAETVFDHYVKEKPILIHNFTGEEYSWDDAFGDSFADVSKTLRHSLVGLVEGEGRYRIKQKD